MSAPKLPSVATAALATLLVALSYAAALVASGEYPYRLFDGDFVHPFLLVRDLASGGSLFDWLSSAALYAFPDWFFALTALLPMPGRATAIVTSILLIGAFAFAGGQLLRPYLRSASAAQAIVLYGVGLVVITLIAGLPIQWLLNYAASLYIHTGAALLLLVSIWLGRMALSLERPVFTTIALSLTSAATIFSDPIFLPWFTVPFLAAAAILALATGSARLLVGPAVVFLLSVLAFLAERFKPFPSVEAPLFAVDPLSSAREFARVMFEGLRDGDGALYAYTLAGLLSLVLLIRTVLALFRSRSTTPVLAQNLLLALSTLAIIVLPIIAGAIDHASKLRYFIALVYLAPVLLMAPLLPALSRVSPRHMAAVASVSLFALLVVLSPGLARAFQTGQHAPLIACLDARGLSDGYADYDYAKSVMFLSDGRIHLSQAGWNTRVNYTSRWRDRRMDGTPFAPNFVITKNLSEDYLARFGPPDEVLPCPDNPVWVYHQGLPPDVPL